MSPRLSWPSWPSCQARVCPRLHYCLLTLCVCSRPAAQLRLRGGGGTGGRPAAAETRTVRPGCKLPICSSAIDAVNPLPSHPTQTPRQKWHGRTWAWPASAIGRCHLSAVSGCYRWRLSVGCAQGSRECFEGGKRKDEGGAGMREARRRQGFGHRGHRGAGEHGQAPYDHGERIRCRLPALSSTYARPMRARIDARAAQWGC